MSHLRLVVAALVACALVIGFERVSTLAGLRPGARTLAVALTVGLALVGPRSRPQAPSEVRHPSRVSPLAAALVMALPLVVAAALDLRAGADRAAWPAWAAEWLVIWVPAGLLAERARRTQAARAAWQVMFYGLWVLPPLVAFAAHLAQSEGPGGGSTPGVRWSPTMRLLERLVGPAAGPPVDGVFRVDRVALRLVGPLDLVRARAASGPETVAAVDVPAGEERELLLPVAMPLELPAELALDSLLLEPRSAVRTVAAAPAMRPPDPRLLARTRPPTAADAAALAPLSAALFVGAVVLAVVCVSGRRRRSWLALVPVAVVCVLVTTLRPAGTTAVESVLELVSEPSEPLGVRGLLCRVARGQVALAPLSAIRLEVRGARGELVLDVSAGDLGPRVACTAVAPGGDLVVFEAHPSAAWAGLLAEGAPRGELEALWVRADDGSWTARGAWPQGAPEPGPDPRAAPPPAWLRGGLPAGRAARAGRIASAGDGPGWVRAVGG